MLCLETPNSFLLSVSHSKGNGPTQGQRQALTRVQHGQRFIHTPSLLAVYIARWCGPLVRAAQAYGQDSIPTLLLLLLLGLSLVVSIKCTPFFEIDRLAPSYILDVPNYPRLIALLLPVFYRYFYHYHFCNFIFQDPSFNLFKSK